MSPGLLACLQALGLVSTRAAQALHVKELRIKHSWDLVSTQLKAWLCQTHTSFRG